MSNTHALPDMLLETMARESDLLPAAIVSTTWPTPPGSGLTLPAFATKGYVRKSTALYYVDQPAIPVTIPNVAGNHWLAITTDTYSAMAGWTRVPGSHYVQQQSASQPAGLDGLLGMAQVVVSGGNVTTVTPLASIYGLPAAWRTLLGLGTMAVQNASAVSLTGVLAVDGSAYVSNRFAIGTTDLADNCFLKFRWPHQTHFGMRYQPTDNDTGAGHPLEFQNLAGTTIGSIATTASATAFNTSSDGRLKEAIEALPHALETIQRLLPVQFRWKATGEVGQGFIAQDVQPLVPQAVTGSPEDPAPTMQMDLSKLVPHLVGAIKDLAGQVQTLTTRLAVLEASLPA